MKFGSLDIIKLYLGNSEVSKIYLGNISVYEESDEPVPPTPPTPSSEIDVTDYQYTLEGTSVTLDKYIGSDTDVTVPNV